MWVTLSMKLATDYYRAQNRAGLLNLHEWRCCASNNIGQSITAENVRVYVFVCLFDYSHTFNPEVSNLRGYLKTNFQFFEKLFLQNFCHFLIFQRYFCQNFFDKKWPDFMVCLFVGKIVTSAEPSNFSLEIQLKESKKVLLL